jgi:hypothetical protein
MRIDDWFPSFLVSDGDMITIFDSSDLAFAIQCCRVLKLRIYFKKDEAKKVTNLPVSLIRSELRDIRDKVSRFLDMLDDSEGIVIGDGSTGGSSGSRRGTSEMEKERSAEANKKKQNGAVGVPGNNNFTGITTNVPSSHSTPGKEFDPLQQQPQSVAASAPLQVINCY